jgi:hypothetical protein
VGRGVSVITQAVDHGDTWVLPRAMQGPPSRRARGPADRRDLEIAEGMRGHEGPGGRLADGGFGSEAPIERRKARGRCLLVPTWQNRPRRGIMNSKLPFHPAMRAKAFAPLPCFRWHRGRDGRCSHENSFW